LLDRLQNGTHRGNGGAADQSIHGRMGFRTACKGKPQGWRLFRSRALEEENYVFGLRKIAYPQDNSYIYIYIINILIIEEVQL
jgi:hypothetical protein